MTDQNMELLMKIQNYAEKVLGDIDPQKVHVSAQLEALKPIMTEIAEEKNMSLEDVFILYMDLASEAAVTADAKMKEDLTLFDLESS